MMKKKKKKRKGVLRSQTTYQEREIASLVRNVLGRESSSTDDSIIADAVALFFL